MRSWESTVAFVRNDVMGHRPRFLILGGDLTLKYGHFVTFLSS